MWPTWKQWHLHSLPKFVDYLWLLKTAWFANASLNADELRNQKLINLTAEELFFVSTFVVSISLTSSTQPHFIFIFPSIDLILFFFVLNISYSLSKLIYFIVPFFFSLYFYFVRWRQRRITRWTVRKSWNAKSCFYWIRFGCITLFTLRECSIIRMVHY